MSLILFVLAMVPASGFAGSAIGVPAAPEDGIRWPNRVGATSRSWLLASTPKSIPALAGSARIAATVAEVRAAWLNPWAFNSPETRTATLAKIRRGNLNTVFLQTPSVTGNYGVTWGGASHENYLAFLDDLKEVGVSAHGWIINRNREGESEQADFTAKQEREAQRQWALDVLATYSRLDGVHFDYIRYGEWAMHDRAKARGVTKTVRITMKAIRKKYPGKFLTAAVFVAAAPSYMGNGADGKRSWSGSPPKWFGRWLDANPDNWYVQRAKEDSKLETNWILGPSFFKYQQQPVTWLEKGFIDAIFPMQYTTHEALWAAEVNLWKSFRKGNMDGIIMGLGWLREEGHPDWDLKPEALVRFIRYGRSRGLKGFSIFSLGAPGADDDVLMQALAEPCSANGGNPPCPTSVPGWLSRPQVGMKKD